MSAAKKQQFSDHIHDQVSWLNSEGNTVAAAHILWALVYFCLNDLDGGGNARECAGAAEAKAKEWLEDSGWADRKTVGAKLDALDTFVDDSICRLFP